MHICPHTHTHAQSTSHTCVNPIHPIHVSDDPCHHVHAVAPFMMCVMPSTRCMMCDIHSIHPIHVSDDPCHHVHAVAPFMMCVIQSMCVT